MSVVEILTICTLGIYGFVELLKRAIPQIPDRILPLIAYVLSGGATVAIALTQHVSILEAFLVFFTMGVGAGGVNGLMKTYLPNVAQLGLSQKSSGDDVPTVVSPNEEYPE